MRVGANVRQYHRIKKWHAEGVSPRVIAQRIQMTDQSLEKILANLEGREERILAADENSQVQALRLQNTELAEKLAKYEGTSDGETTTDTEEEEAQET